MCHSPLHALLQQLPKCEHHMHLEGALTPTLLFALASRNEISLPIADDAFRSPDSLLERYSRFISLDDFLHYYYIGMSVLIHASDFEALAWDYFEHASASGVHHAELFFDPQAHLSRGISYSTVTSGFQSACRRAERELGITTILTACYLRHLPVADSLAVFDNEEVQASYQSGAVRGIGLDSSELDFPPHLFKPLYDKARAKNLHLTAHAGEEGPASYIASALSDLGISRIDHGIALADDDDLLREVAEKGIMLTVCPVSNVVLRCVKSVAELPIRKFLDKGVRFSINSDDPAYFGAYVLECYCAVQEAFDLSVAEWERVCQASIEGSWCGEGRKRELLDLLGRVVGEWKGRTET